MRRRDFLRSAGAVVVASTVSSCVRRRADYAGPQAGGQDGEVVVVGRIELLPGLRPSDQDIHTVLSPYEYENTVYVLVGDELRTFTDEPDVADYQDNIAAHLGETFFKLLPARPQFISLSVIFMRVDAGGVGEKVYLPGQLGLDIEQGDGAVYIGTIRYHRNPYFEVQRVEVVDELESAEAEYRSRFPGGPKLRRCLARMLSGKAE